MQRRSLTLTYGTWWQGKRQAFSSTSFSLLCSYCRNYIKYRRDSIYLVQCIVFLPREQPASPPQGKRLTIPHQSESDSAPWPAKPAAIVEVFPASVMLVRSSGLPKKMWGMVRASARPPPRIRPTPCPYQFFP